MFNKKVSEVETHLVELSSSLQTTSSYGNLATRRKELFSRINAIKSKFTPYERFLYYNQDNKNTASCPGIGKNLFSEDFIHSEHNTKLINHEGFNYVFKGESHQENLGENISIFRGMEVEKPPFFNDSGSFYLSWLMKGTDGITGTSNYYTIKMARECNAKSNPTCKPTTSKPKPKPTPNPHLCDFASNSKLGLPECRKYHNYGIKYDNFKIKYNQSIAIALGQEELLYNHKSISYVLDEYIDTKKIIGIYWNDPHKNSPNQITVIDITKPLPNIWVIINTYWPRTQNYYQPGMTNNSFISLQLCN